MERYTLGWADLYMDDLLDKMGSDYFPLPVKYDRFKTIALDFIREATAYLESNQEISDDIKTLLIRKRVDLVQDPLRDNIYNAPEPIDYLRLAGLVPLYYDNILNQYVTKSRIVSIIKEGQRQTNERDPFRTSNHEYPSVIRLANIFEVNVGNGLVDYTKADLSYVKKPTFADIENETERIVDLPDISIEKILAKTTDSLRMGVGDSSAPANYQFHETFGKKNK